MLTCSPTCSRQFGSSLPQAQGKWICLCVCPCVSVCRALTSFPSNLTAVLPCSLLHWQFCLLMSRKQRVFLPSMLEIGALLPSCPLSSEKQKGIISHVQCGRKTVNSLPHALVFFLVSTIVLGGLGHWLSIRDYESTVTLTHVLFLKKGKQQISTLW